MNRDDHQDQLVDMLLWETIGKETPPDVRARVLDATSSLPQTPATRRAPPRKLASFRPAKRSKLPVFALAATLALFAGGLAFLQIAKISKARTPVLAIISGTSVNRSPGPIDANGKLTTGADATVKLTFPDGTVVTVMPHTTLAVADRQPWDRSKGLDLASGELMAEVAPQRDGEPFVVESDFARAEVIGTQFIIRAREGNTRLEVTEGEVLFVPESPGDPLLVQPGRFAESGSAGFSSGPIPPSRGIVGFTLMNPYTDEPMRDRYLTDGETLALRSLPAPAISIRADYEGDAPDTVTFVLNREDGAPIDLPSHIFEAQVYPPFFIVGDYWKEGRPNDCRPWVPEPGIYQLSADATYSENGTVRRPAPLKIRFRIAD